MMPRFKGSYEETFTVDGPVDQVKSHFGDLDTIARNYGPLSSFSKVDEHTLHLVLTPQSDKGVTFHGEQKCRYEFLQPDVLTWKTVETKNLWSEGTAEFRAMTPERTTVVYKQRMECEMQVNTILARVIRPIVSHRIASGVRDYVKRMRDDFKAT